MSQLDTSAPPSERVRPVFRRRGRRLPFLLQFLDSPVALKWIMAWSGIIGMLYVLVHMIGNLHLFEGPEQVNSYGEALRGLGGELAPRTAVLWVLRSGLIAALLVHVLAAYRLTVVNYRARPTRYKSRRDYVAADYASRTMRISGIWLLGFIGYHLADLTWGWANPDYVRGDVYHNVVESFTNPIVAAFYIVSMGALALHLFHGAWSIFQSLGINSPRYNSWRRGFATGFALIVLVGNLSFPVAVQLGLISEDDRVWPPEPAVEEFKEIGLNTATIERLAESCQDDDPDQQVTCMRQQLGLPPGGLEELDGEEGQ